MNIIAIIATAFGLSMDAFAVSITDGMLIDDVKTKDALKVGAYFGIAQAIMPLIGWLSSIYFQKYIEGIDHWIALLLLGFIGGKMIYESIKSRKDDCVKKEKNGDILSNKTLFILAIATSIDALVVGISFAFLKVPIVESIIIIGIVTFIMCFIGVMIGKRCGSLLKNNIEIIGGIILILIGVNIFLEHVLG